MSEQTVGYFPEDALEVKTNNSERIYLPHASVSEKVKFSEALSPLEVYRDGPRFYCARVTDGEDEFVIKDTVYNPELNSDPNDLDSPRAHLLTEIEMLSFLNSKASGSEISQKLLVANNGSEPWYATEFCGQGWLGMHSTPFFYNLENLRTTSPQSIFEGINSLQALTTETNVPPWITREDRAQTNQPDLSKPEIGFLSEKSGLPKEEIERAYVKALQIRADMPRVLTHGEVYPQHIFIPEGANTAKFIDWENAKLGDKLLDHAAVWLRTFEEPEWQASYFKLVSHQEGFDQAGWNANVFLTAMGNFNYLSSVDQVEPDRREAAVQFCYRTALEAVAALAKTP